MKRSEMVKLITEVVLNEKSEFTLTKDEADLILKKIEEAGMESPPHQEQFGTGYPDEYGFEMIDVRWAPGWEQE